MTGKAIKSVFVQRETTGIAGTDAGRLHTAGNSGRTAVTLDQLSLAVKTGNVMGAGCSTGLTADAFLADGKDKTTGIPYQCLCRADLHAGCIRTMQTAAGLIGHKAAFSGLFLVNAARNRIILVGIIVLVYAGHYTGQAARAVFQITNDFRHIRSPSFPDGSNRI